MKVNLKSVNGLQTDTMIFNFHMQEEDEKERILTNKIIDLRRIEIRERLEGKQQESISTEDVGNKLENYVINAFAGKPVYVLNDYEKKDEVQDKGKGGDKRMLKRNTA